MLILWLTCLNLLHAAPKRALLLGGGGDPAGPSTSFDQTLAPIARALDAGGYESSAAFDGGHVRTDEVLRDEFKDAAPFTAAVTEAKIDQLERDLRAGRIKQLMVIVNSHGALDKPAGAVHVVEGKDQPFDLGALKRLQTAARIGGGRLAILDHSCYSGQTQALASPETCVISAGSDQTVSYIGFVETLFGELKPGQSLESAFLSARRKSDGPTWPQIGTPAGAKARLALTGVHEEASAFPADLRARDGLLGGARLCLTSVQRQFGVLTGVLSAANRIDRDRLGELARDNQAYQSLRTTKVAELVTSNRTFTLPSGFKVSYQTLLTLDETMRQANLMAHGGADSPFRDVIKHEREIRAFRTELMARLPKFRDDVSVRAERSANNSPVEDDPDRELLAAGDRLASSERKVYDAVYQDAAAKNKGANPCRDFKF